MEGRWSNTLKVLPLIVLLCTLCCSPVNAANNALTVFTENNCTNSCLTLDTALQSVESNTTLLLEAGLHVVRSDYAVTGITDLNIIGDASDPSSVIIKCEDTYGLIFMEIERLNVIGLTVHGCGYTGYENVTALFSFVKRSTNFFYEPLFLFSTGIFMFDIQDLVMENTTIEGNKGFGLVGVNIIGNSRFSHVNVLSNYPDTNISICNFEVTFAAGGSGGGLFLFYDDYIEQSKNDIAQNTTLIFENTLVKDNYNCRRDPFVAQYNMLSRTLELTFASNTSICGSGGATFSLGQTRYSVDIKMDKCDFENNTGLYHNSALEFLLYNLTAESVITIQNTRFRRNGGLFFDPNDRAQFPDNGLDAFGALGIVFFLPLPTNVSDASSMQPLPNPSRVYVLNCSFIENMALTGAGLMLFSFTTTSGFINDMATVKDCVFFRNTADYGSALFITELSYSAFESRLGILLDSITVHNSSQLPTPEGLTQTDTLSAVDFSNVRVHLVGHNTFFQNKMTAVALHNAILEVAGFGMFFGNSGVNGGGLHLERESYLVLVNQTELLFSNNSATLRGGAIYIDFRTVRASTYDCWLFMETIDIFCDVTDVGCPIPNNRFILKFLNNKAALGSSIYGSNLFNCPWSIMDPYSINISAVEGFPDISHLDPTLLPLLYDPPIDNDDLAVNTFPLLLTGVPQGRAPIRKSEDVTVEPGQQFEVQLSAFDRLGQPVPLTIFSIVDNEEANSTISTSNRLLLPGGAERFTTVPIRVFGLAENDYTVTITSNEVFLRSEYTIFVRLVNCSPGFIYIEDTRDCECEIDQFFEGVECNNDGTISFMEGDWIGYDEVFYMKAPCIRDFCEPGVNTVKLSEPDTQCRNNRSGHLCGGCAKGSSRILGASDCSSTCTNNNYLALIVLFAAAGFVPFILLAIFNITITDGLINGFIFYANIFSVYTATFFSATNIRGAPSIVLISWLNLNFGIQSCFYVGMTELDLVGLTLIFPVYLMLILLGIVLFARTCTHEKLTAFYQKINITHMFATLLVLCYASVIETCIAILAGISVQIDQNGSEVILWARDPNVGYGSDIHGLLVAISLLMLLVLLPLPVILLVPNISFRVRCVRKFKPLIDAFIAPFEHNKAFWVSFRLIFRVIIYIIGAAGVNTWQLVVMSAHITSLTLLQAYLKPYKQTSRNIIDIFLMYNLTLFSIVAVFLFEKPSTFEDSVMDTIFAFLYIFGIMILFLFAHYVLKRFECSRKPYEKIVDWTCDMLQRTKEYLKNPYCCCSKNAREKKKNSKKISVVSINGATNAGFPNDITHTSVVIGDRYTFALRESLLEESSSSSKRNISANENVL